MPKMDYFGSKSLKIAQALGAPPPDPLAFGGWGLRPQTSAQVKWLENVQNSIFIEITGWCRCLANLGAKCNLYFRFLPPSSPCSKKCSRGTGNRAVHSTSYNLWHLSNLLILSSKRRALNNLTTQFKTLKFKTLV